MDIDPALSYFKYIIDFEDYLRGSFESTSIKMVITLMFSPFYFCLSPIALTMESLKYIDDKLGIQIQDHIPDEKTDLISLIMIFLCIIYAIYWILFLIDNLRSKDPLEGKVFTLMIESILIPFFILHDFISIFRTGRDRFRLFKILSDKIVALVQSITFERTRIIRREEVEQVEEFLNQLDDKTFKERDINLNFIDPSDETSTDDHDRCCVCLQRKTRSIFNPCRHNSCCISCSIHLKTCPICRKNIKDYDKVIRT
jgi:hypothetical protein